MKTSCKNRRIKLQILLYKLYHPIVLFKVQTWRASCRFRAEKSHKDYDELPFAKMKNCCWESEERKNSFVVIISQHIFLAKLLNKAEQNRWKGDKNKINMFSFFLLLLLWVQIFLVFETEYVCKHGTVSTISQS